ncbi:MAG: hypothetical protein ABI658_32630 [Acidimicrobiales bacterium]
MTRLILAAGAFIALDRNDRPMWARMVLAHRSEQPIVTHAGIIGQIWRNPARQARLAQALKAVDVRPLGLELAQAAGQLLAAAGRHDVHDAALALLCEPDDLLFTSDIDDLATLLAERRVRSVGILRV